MPKFVYKAGMEFNKGDDTETTAKRPAEVTLFGVDFLKGQAVAVEPDMFDEPKKYAHAVMKLRTHPHFEEVTVAEIEDAKFEDVPADKPRRGRPPKTDEPAE
jgi:hypothetical protein